MVAKKSRSGIHIKKSKQGSFTKAAKKAGKTVPEETAAVLKKGSKASPAMKKKAVFAKNARSWHHGK